MHCRALRSKKRPNDKGGILKINLSSDLTELARARRFVLETAQRMTNERMSPEKIAELQLAVTEALTNVIKHSYNGEKGHPIELAAESFADGIQIIIYHCGTSFDPQSAPPPVFDGTRDGGFGLFIISKCVDFFGYSTDKNQRNSIRLIKISKSRKKNEDTSGTS